MFTVELYAKIRHAVMIDGLSRREAAKRFGVHRNTIAKMLSFSVPPGYRRRERPTSKKLGPYLAWIDGVPQSILYDNTKLAVAKIVKGGKRLRSKMFAELQSHYLFEDRFGRPGKGNDKGNLMNAAKSACIRSAIDTGWPRKIAAVTARRTHSVVHFASAIYSQRHPFFH